MVGIPQEKNYQMAVPYRGKDVAAEKTEFGHPDVALSLTVSHYYQQGLSEHQLRDVFDKLKDMSESKAKSIYRGWLKEMKEVDSQAPEILSGITSLEGLNLEDSQLFSQKIYPAFHRHMEVISFWLYKLILPVQAKQFPRKLVSTAPDLCRSAALCPLWKSVTTGFSGTDDLKHVLPETIKQKNLKAFSSASGVQLRNILTDENNRYHALTVEGCVENVTKLYHQRLRQSKF